MYARISTSISENAMVTPGRHIRETGAHIRTRPSVYMCARTLLPASLVRFHGPTCENVPSQLCVAPTSLPVASFLRSSIPFDLLCSTSLASSFIVVLPKPPSPPLSSSSRSSTSPGAHPSWPRRGLSPRPRRNDSVGTLDRGAETGATAIRQLTQTRESSFLGSIQ